MGRRRDKRKENEEKIKFVVPNQQACAEAIGIMWKKVKGDKKQLVLKNKDVYEDGNIGDIKLYLDPTPFSPIPKPEEGDWLDEFPEPGDTFYKFAKNNEDKKVTWENDSIYVMPLGNFNTPELKQFCETLTNYCALFFCMKIETMESIDISENKKLKRRMEPYKENNNVQFLTTDLLKIIENNLPARGYCGIGITLEDLYPEAGWNFVFGEANPDKGTGIFSFVRYSPQFYNEPKTEATDHLLLERSLKVMVHEIGHMFGLPHCIYFNCIMNGSNSLEEEDRISFHLCPVCLRKLHFVINFDIKQRYIGLQKFFQENGFQQEADWIKQWIA